MKNFEYVLILNDSIYGVGDMKYMNELIHDRLIHKNNYDQDRVKFEILPHDEVRENFMKDIERGMEWATKKAEEKRKKK